MTRRFVVSSGAGYDAAVCTRLFHSKLKKLCNMLRIGKLYTYYLYAEGAEGKALVEKQIGKMLGNLVKEESDICRYNTMALYYLAEAKCGEKEDIIKWLRNTGGDIANKKGKTNFHMTAQVKIHLYLGNYSQAEKILNILMTL